MDYFVKCEDVNSVSISFDESLVSLVDGLDAVSASIDMLFDYGLIEGDAATSARDYFMTVHNSLIFQLEATGNTLSDAYVAEYANDFNDIGEGYDAALPENIMEEKAKWAEDLVRCDIFAIDSLLNQSIALLPSGFSLKKPSMSDISDMLYQESDRTNAAREKVKANEICATDSFKDQEGTLVALLSSIRQFMSTLRKQDTSLFNYSPSHYENALAQSGIEISLASAEDYSYSNAETIMVGHENIFSTENARLSEIERKEAEKKRTWAIIGTIAGIVGLCAGGWALAGAIAGSGTVLGIIAGGIGVYQSSTDVYGRIKQLDEMDKGNYGADKEKNDPAGLSEGKKIIKTMDGVVEEKGDKVYSQAGKIIIDESADYIKDKTDDRNVVLGVDLTAEGLKEKYSSWVKSKFEDKATTASGGSGGKVDFISKIVQTVSDSFVGKHDDVLQEIEDQRSVIGRQKAYHEGRFA